MSKKRTEINPKRAERVKLIRTQEGLNQTEFANLTNQVQQNINRIEKMHQGLTEENAREIIKAFPRYRLQWLLGYDDIMTVDDEISNYFELKNKAADGMWAIIEKSLSKHGKSLRFVHRQGQHIDATERVRADCYYSIVDKTGNEKKRLSSVDMILFEEKIQEYCDFLTEKYLCKEDQDNEAGKR